MAEPGRAAPPDATPLIRFESITKSFAGVQALAGVSLSIARGEFFCLLGPSGCGKTTLMRMLAGFEQPDGGAIFLDGQDLRAIPPHRRPVNMMFQSYALFPHMSVESNIGFGLRQEGLPRAEIAERVAAMVRTVQLGGLEKRRPDQLSGGQRQRVALARALIKRPKVLLLDEPLGALDKKLREETQFELKDLQAELGLTFLMVTHDQDEAMVMADRIGVMEKGRLVQVGTPLEVYEAPTTRAVAEFVGAITMFDGIAGVREGEWLRVQGRPGEGGAPLRLAVVPRDPVPAGTPVTVAIRPEKVHLSQEQPVEGTPNVLAGEVWDVGYFGDSTIYRVRLDDGQIVRVARLNASRRTARPAAAGERVWVAFDPADAILLTR